MPASWSFRRLKWFTLGIAQPDPYAPAAEDFRIDPEEVDVLVLRLKSAQGVKLDEQRFRSEIGQSGYRVSTVLNICKGMLSDDSDESPIHISTKGLKAKHV